MRPKPREKEEHSRLPRFGQSQVLCTVAGRWGSRDGGGQARQRQRCKRGAKRRSPSVHFQGRQTASVNPPTRQRPRGSGVDRYQGVLCCTVGFSRFIRGSSSEINVSRVSPGKGAECGLSLDGMEPAGAQHGRRGKHTAVSGRSRASSAKHGGVPWTLPGSAAWCLAHASPSWSSSSDPVMLILSISSLAAVAF
ncbi:hypothetical protein VTI74DRAFT_6962 [Chaetomium olivicolor]